MTNTSPDERRRRGLDLGVGLFFFAAALVFLFVVVPVGIRVPGRVQHFGLSPAMLPIVTAVLIGTFGAILALRAAFAQALPPPEDELAGEPRVDWWWRLTVAAALAAAYYVVVPWLGMTLTAVLVTAGMMLLGGERRLWLIAMLAVTLPVVVSYLFRGLLYVPLPRGLLFD